MQPLSGCILFHLPAKVYPHPLCCRRASRMFLPAWISCILHTPFSQGCYHFLWHYVGISTVSNLKVINVPFSFRMTVNSSSTTPPFCAPTRNSHDGAVMSSLSKVSLLVVANFWKVLLVSVLTSQLQLIFATDEDRCPASGRLRTEPHVA